VAGNHHAAYGKKAKNITKVMKSFAFAIFILWFKLQKKSRPKNV
jgi:hypothetical protein